MIADSALPKIGGVEMLRYMRRELGLEIPVVIFAGTLVLNDMRTVTELGRAEYVSVTDKQALEAASRLSRAEGLIPALESAHAVAEAIRQAPAAKGEVFVVNLSGRGDKDIDIYRENFPELDSE